MRVRAGRRRAPRRQPRRPPGNTAAWRLPCSPGGRHEGAGAACERRGNWRQRGCRTFDAFIWGQLLNHSSAARALFVGFSRTSSEAGGGLTPPRIGRGASRAPCRQLGRARVWCAAPRSSTFLTLKYIRLGGQMRMARSAVWSRGPPHRMCSEYSSASRDCGRKAARVFTSPHSQSRTHTTRVCGFVETD